MELITKRIIKHDDLAPRHGRLFGGLLLEWLDLDGYKVVKEEFGITEWVTKAIDGEWKGTVGLGDVLAIRGEVFGQGNTSATVMIRAYNEYTDDTVWEGSMTFVRIDENWRPKPIKSV